VCPSSAEQSRNSSYTQDVIVTHTHTEREKRVKKKKKKRKKTVSGYAGVLFGYLLQHVLSEGFSKAQLFGMEQFSGVSR
jgi:hypothetical protein